TIFSARHGCPHGGGRSPSRLVYNSSREEEEAASATGKLAVMEEDRCSPSSLIVYVVAARPLYVIGMHGGWHAAGYELPCTRLEADVPMHGSAWSRGGNPPSVGLR
ncbi:hypothetical protein Dimus_036142, partial [Dionaea muscipula]